MNLMTYWQGIKHLKNILMFHGECKYPMMMQVLHLNSITLFERHFTINVKNFTIPSLLESICKTCYIKHGISILKNPFVSWFKILSQYDASTAFLLGFGMAMHQPSKFEKICYEAQCIFGITYKGYCVVLRMSNTLPIMQTHGV